MLLVLLALKSLLTKARVGNVSIRHLHQPDGEINKMSVALYYKNIITISWRKSLGEQSGPLGGARVKDDGGLIEVGNQQLR